MWLRRLLIQTDVQHNKHVSKWGGGTVFSSVVEPEPQGAASFGGAVAAMRCSSGSGPALVQLRSGSRIKIFYPEPHQNDAARNTCFFLIVLC
jgi:hypothetical protein